MKEKVIHFITALIIYGIIGWLIIYFLEDENYSPWFFVIFWGVSMALAELFIFEKIRNRKKEK